jgi:hypothetical protein
VFDAALATWSPHYFISGVESGQENPTDTRSGRVRLRFVLNFESIRSYFFIVHSTFLFFYGGMTAVKDAGSDTIDWYVEADWAAPPSVRATAYRRRYGEHSDSLGLIITTCLFFVLLSAAVTMGGHAAIGPMLQRATTAQDGRSVGKLIFTMPDGMFCRYLSLDNATDEITEHPIERCADVGASRRPVTGWKFQWISR